MVIMINISELTPGPQLVDKEKNKTNGLNYAGPGENKQQTLQRHHFAFRSSPAAAGGVQRDLQCVQCLQYLCCSLHTPFSVGLKINIS